jgi:hypothetical protein
MWFGILGATEVRSADGGDGALGASGALMTRRLTIINDDQPFDL